MGQLEMGEFLGWHQVILEVLELTRSLHPNISRAQRVL
ncbi:hypothetical protein ALP64_203344 [Pseudomonas syringae pv. actinidiae]|nr:hypothetical protein ALP64_203344 [Pseudomonas syringae pv. actinidiae]